MVGQEFSCKHEDGNGVYPFAVAVVRGDTIMGYVLRKILSICSLYLHRDDSIVCGSTVSRRFFADLAQGRLEIPCLPTFKDTLSMQRKPRS